jgi:hypothetical protein
MSRHLAEFIFEGRVWLKSLAQ